MNYKNLIIGLLISIFSITVQAGHKGKHRGNDHYDHSPAYFYDYARVSSVSPIYETFEHRVPRQCRHQNDNRHYQRSATPMIIGGIIGAAIGNKLGHNKSNKKVGAVAGGVLGAAIGSDINNRSRRHECNDYTIEYEERIVGYDVRYRYRGNSYSTTTREHPGRKIQLKLQLEPVIS